MSPTVGRPRNFDPERVLDQATDLFWRHGYDATSVSALTNSLGITSSSLYATFGDKKQLFRTVVDRYRKSRQGIIDSAFAESSTAIEGVRAYMYALADDYTSSEHPPGCLVISAAINCQPNSEDIEHYLRDCRNQSKRDLIQRLAHDIDRGILSPRPDASQRGTYLAAIIQGMSMQARDGATREELESIIGVGLKAVSE